MSDLTKNLQIFEEQIFHTFKKIANSFSFFRFATLHSFNNCKTKILVLIKELKFIHFLFQNVQHYVNFGDFAYLFFS